MRRKVRLTESELRRAIANVLNNTRKRTTRGVVNEVIGTLKGKRMLRENAFGYSTDAKWGSGMTEEEVKEYYGQPRPREHSHKPLIFDTEEGAVLLDYEKGSFGGWNFYPLLNPDGEETFDSIEELSAYFVMEYNGKMNFYSPNDGEYLSPRWFDDYHIPIGYGTTDVKIRDKWYELDIDSNGVLNLYNKETGDCITQLY